VSSRGRRQSVADLNDVAIGGSFEANATDSQTVGVKPDLVVAERTLLAVLLGSAQKGADGSQVSSERVVGCPIVAWLGCTRSRMRRASSSSTACKLNRAVR